MRLLVQDSLAVPGLAKNRKKQGKGYTLNRRIRMAVLTGALAAAAAFTVAPMAQAGSLVAAAENCDEYTIEQPFLQWGDDLDYHLVPDGGLEGGADGWSLSGGAAVVNGNESFFVRDAGDSKSLSLPPGSSATTPVMCAGIHTPLMRFFAKSSQGLLSLSTLKVDVLFELANGQAASLPVSWIIPRTSWQPTGKLFVLASLLPLLSGQQTPIAFRFRPDSGNATWTIDDVYLDPRHR